jgi:hypothetical protein
MLSRKESVREEKRKLPHFSVKVPPKRRFCAGLQGDLATVRGPSAVQGDLREMGMGIGALVV